MSDDPHATIEVCVEIRYLRQLSIGAVLASKISRLFPGDEPLVWLPRAEIRTIGAQAGNITVIEIPRWLAEKEGLTDTAEAADPNQGILL